MKSFNKFRLRCGDGYSIAMGKGSFIYITLKDNLEVEILGAEKEKELTRLILKEGQTYSFKRDLENDIDTYNLTWELGELIIKIKSESKDYLRTR